MSEFIGSRISLISKRDIRYVGTLHEISSENSTVALEQVVSFGTEGRRPDDEVPPSDNVYEYIVFRGSDVKDLRIEEAPKENIPPQPPVPDDPAILGSARRPVSATVAKPSQDAAAKTQAAQPQPQPQNQQLPKPTVQTQPPHLQQRQQQQQHQQHQQPPPPHFQQHPPYPYPYPPRFGPQGFPPGPGFPGMPYGAPPGWYPPPGYGYPPMPPGQFRPNQMPIGPPAQQPRQQPTQPTPVQAPIPSGPAVTGGPSSAAESASPLKPTATVKLPSATSTPVPPPTLQNAPPPPTESKPDVAAALAPPAPIVSDIGGLASKVVPTGPKSGRIIPAVPLPSPNIRTSSTVNGTLKAVSGKAVQVEPAQDPAKLAASKPAPIQTKSIEEATRDARAAVAAAMAKLPPAPGHKKQGEGSTAMDNLTKKVNEMRTNDNIRTSRQPGTGGYAAGHRRAERGQHRGGRRHSEQKKVDVPTTDYDFASANAKFNKQDLVKEAIASGSPFEAEEPMENRLDSTVNGERKNSESTVAYNKSSSFFDNISSESKDRSEEGGNRLGGREFRSEERQKNLETFGQGSVDNGYRGGYGRGGRGRGRGYGRGRGARGSYEGRGGRNGLRGGRGAVATEG